MSAGLMHRVRNGGHRVVVATATKGEHGTDDPDRLPPARLAVLREREMAASLAAVGVREHHWLGHVDGTLNTVDAEFGIGQVIGLIRKVEPTTIVTFGPDGMTGHTDHQTISHWVTAAWLATGRTAQLWYATVTPEFHQTWGTVNEEVDFFFAGTQPPSDRPEDLAYQVDCDGPTLDAKYAALQAHASQTTGLINALGVEVYRRWWATEYFADAARADRPAFA